MYNMNDILTQLQGGQSADQIAQAFTDALNAAIQEQEKQAQANSKRAAKVDAMTAIVDLILDFVEEFYPDLIPADAEIEIATEDIEEMIDMLDEAIPQVAQLSAAVAGLEKLVADKPTPSKIEPKVVKAKSFDDAMAQFFKMNGLM